MESITIDNGIERDVEDTDYRCDECSTDLLAVFHEGVNR